jgi:hypothetical protein
MDTALLILIGILATIVIISIVVFVLRRMKGTIEIKLENYQVSSGENINGNVLLKLKKDVEGNELVVSLIGETKKKSTHISRDGKRSTDYSNERVFEFNLPIDIKKTYNVGEKNYPFSIKTPKSTEDITPKLKGVAETIFKSITALSGTGAPIRWFVQAHLDAKGVDLYSKEIQVNIT